MSFIAAVLKSKKKLFWTVTSAILVVDQLTKLLFWRLPDSGANPLVLIPHVLRFVPHEGNVRGALGLGPGTPAVWVTAAILGLMIIWMFFVTTPARKVVVHVALGLLAGGATGNLIDRVLLGRVRDFIDLHWGEVYHWHTFNVADAAICVGFLMVVLDVFFSRDQRPASTVSRPDSPGRR